MEATKNNRFTFIDGLKGIACLGVFTHHFLLSYFPASYFGNEARIMTESGIDAKLSYEPYGFFTNGSFWVCTFLFLSAFLLSNKIFRLKEKENSNPFSSLSSILMKRYVRLMVPTALVAIFHFFLIELLVATKLNYISTGNILSFPKLLFHSIVSIWIQIDTSVIGHFWMMHYLLFGSYLAILLALAVRPAKTMKEYFSMQGVLLFATAALGFKNRYLIGILLGVMLCYELHYGKIISYLQEKWLGRVLGVLLLLAGLFFGAYPSYVKPENIYRIFNAYSFRDPDAFITFHCLGAFCLVASFFLLKSLARLFSTRFFQYIGRLSFSIYLIHIFLLEDLGYYWIHHLSEAIGSYSLAGVLVYIVLFLLLLPCAQLCCFTVERFGNWVCRKLFPEK